jgi:hypothetical protein
MAAVRAEDLEKLLAALPRPDDANEVILRPDGDVPLAMLRSKGQPPRCFVLQDGAVEELLPEADPGLAAARLFGKKSRMIRALAPTLGDVAEPRLIAWRPQKRAVVRVLQDGVPVFVKFLDRKTYRRAKEALQRLPDAPAPLVFAKATHFLDDVCGYVAPGAPGECLRDLFAAQAPAPWSLLDAAVRALRAAPLHDGLPRIDFTAALDAGVRMLRKGAVRMPELTPLADRLAGLRAPAALPEGFVHGDFHDRQLFFAGDRVSLIDLEGVGRGDPTFDLVNMAEQARLRALQQRGEDDGSGTLLLDRFEVDEDRRRRWGVAVRARLCGVYALRPRWVELTRRLAAESASLLDGLGP